MATTPKKSAAKTAATSNEASFVKELADILDQAGLAELEYETEAVAIRLSRFTTAAPVAAAAPHACSGHPDTDFASTHQHAFAEPCGPVKVGRVPHSAGIDRVALSACTE